MWGSARRCGIIGVMVAMTYMGREPLDRLLLDLEIAQDARECLYDCQQDAERDALIVALGDVVLMLLAELERRGGMVDAAREWALAG